MSNPKPQDTCEANYTAYTPNKTTIIGSQTHAPFPILTPDQHALLPTSKHDFASVKHLMSLPAKEINPLIPHLLTWLQDINWPISLPIASLLLLQPGTLGVAVMDILLGEGEDDTWRNYILEYLILPLANGEGDGVWGSVLDGVEWMGLKEELERVAEKPTGKEKGDWEMDVLAAEILGRWRMEAVDEEDEDEELRIEVEGMDCVD